MNKNLATHRYFTSYYSVEGYTHMDPHWIGRDDRNQEWHDGTPYSWSNYNAGEPNEVANHCTILQVSVSIFGWVDAGCHWLRMSLCQIHIPSGRCWSVTIGLHRNSIYQLGYILELLSSLQ